MALGEQALKETAAYLMARAAGEAPAPPTLEAATEAIVALIDVMMPGSAGRELIAAIRAASVSNQVTMAMAGGPTHVLRAEDVLKDALIHGQVQSRVLQERMLDAEAAATLLGSKSETNLRQYANTQRLRGDLLGVPRKNAYWYPAFQFDVERGCINDTAREVHQLLGAKDDPWGVASWWTTPSERLRNRAPMDLLGTDEEQDVVLLAQADLAPVG